MKESMSKDKTKHNILPLSKFGLMQITRQRVRPEMHIETAESCPTCHGTGKVQPPILFPDLVKSEISTIIQQNNLKRLNVHLHPFIAHSLKRGLRSTEKKWRRELACKIRIIPDESNHFLEYAVYSDSGEELQRKNQ
jgi:ribonuclease G